MGKRTTKASKKFASSGKLKKTIQARHKRQQIQKNIQSRRGAHKPKAAATKKDAEDSEDEDEEQPTSTGKSKMTVDDFLGAGFMDDDSDREQNRGEEDEAVSDEEGDDDDEDAADDASFASVDDLDDQGEAHMQELSKLAEKDPEFYKYLQENDKELLKFDLNAMDHNDSDEAASNGDNDEMETERQPILTKAQLQKWQKALLEQRSLRALRRLLLAFKSAVYMNEDGHALAWSIDNSSVYNKLLLTTLKYTPVVLVHHAPYKTLPNGKIKPPTQTAKLKTLQKMILNYFHNVINLISQLSDEEMLEIAVTESAKTIPYILSSRKAVKQYLKKCLELWSSSHDNVRIASFVAIRKLASTTDESILDHVLKGSYLTLIRSSKSTTAHSLPSINLMKNSASEVFCLDHAKTYQHAFGYIRQLAIHLRNSMKVNTKESYKLVYNWQYIHCIDFWSIVLARACDAQSERQNGKPSELKPLIYPLVQVCLGAIKLISHSRSYPFHLHIIRSLLHLTRHTETYVPISPYLLPILTSTLTPSSRPKASTLRPLDLEVSIRAPQQYAKTRVYGECIIEESAHLMAEWLVSTPVHGSIGFPEVIITIVIQLRRTLKAAKASGHHSKELGQIKTLVERIEDSAQWVEGQRNGVSFAPGKLTQVETWERDLASRLDESPLSKYVTVQRKAREKRQKLVEKALRGEKEILDSA